MMVRNGGRKQKNGAASMLRSYLARGSAVEGIATSRQRTLHKGGGATKCHHINYTTTKTTS